MSLSPVVRAVGGIAHTTGVGESRGSGGQGARVFNIDCAAVVSSGIGATKIADRELDGAMVGCVARYAVELSPPDLFRSTVQPTGGWRNVAVVSGWRWIDDRRSRRYLSSS